MEESRGYREHEKVAILVDGGFYLRRAHHLFGEKSAKDRAQELMAYCARHAKKGGSLYRVFYYDCPPITTPLYHPLHKKQIAMKDTDRYKWSMEFLEELAEKRKLAIRLGDLQEKDSGFTIKQKTLRRLCAGTIAINNLKPSDFMPNIVQKGVDMRIGLDIASIAYKKQATQIVLISGDSDFVPAAKHARREGIDFILDPMWQGIRPDLKKHIDGLRSCTSEHPTKDNEKLCSNEKSNEAKDTALL